MKHQQYSHLGSYWSIYFFLKYASGGGMFEHREWCHYNVCVKGSLYEEKYKDNGHNPSAFFFYLIFRLHAC